MSDKNLNVPLSVENRSRSVSPSDAFLGSEGRSSFRRSEARYDPNLNPFGDDDEEENKTGDDDKLIAGDATTPPRPLRSSINPFLSASIKKKAAPSPPNPNSQNKRDNVPDMSASIDPPSEMARAGAKNTNAYANTNNPDDESEALLSDDLGVTSGVTNELQAEIEAPPVTVVSVQCLISVYPTFNSTYLPTKTVTAWILISLQYSHHLFLLVYFEVNWITY